MYVCVCVFSNQPYVYISVSIYFLLRDKLQILTTSWPLPNGYFTVA